jgi:hypothetical protein
MSSSNNKHGRRTRQHASRGRRQRPGGMANVISRPLRAVDSVFTCVQALEINGGGALTSSVSAATFNSIGLSLNAFDQASQLAAVFDWYRFTEVEYTFLPRVRSTVSNDQAFSVTPNIGIFHSVVDTNTLTPLTTVPQALDYPSCKAWSAGSPNSLLVQRFVPKTALGSAAGTIVNPVGVWYSTNVNSTPWAGVLTAWTITSQVYYMDAIIRVKVQFKNTR